MIVAIVVLAVADIIVGFTELGFSQESPDNEKFDHYCGDSVYVATTAKYSNDKELEEIFKVWAKPEVISMINEVGEIENPIPLGTKMLKEIPEFRKLAGKAIKSVLWS